VATHAAVMGVSELGAVVMCGVERYEQLLAATNVVHSDLYQAM